MADGIQSYLPWKKVVRDLPVLPEDFPAELHRALGATITPYSPTLAKLVKRGNGRFILENDSDLTSWLSLEGNLKINPGPDGTRLTINWRFPKKLFIAFGIFYAMGALGGVISGGDPEGIGGMMILGLGFIAMLVFQFRKQYPVLENQVEAAFEQMQNPEIPPSPANDLFANV